MLPSACLLIAIALFLPALAHGYNYLEPEVGAPVVEHRSLLCASVLGALEPVVVQAPQDFSPILVTPRFLMTGAVLLRDGHDYVGSMLYREPSSSRVGHFPLGFDKRFRMGPGRLPGMGTEVRFARTRHAFEVLGFEAISAGIYKSNAASIGLARKLGFKVTADLGDIESWLLTREDFESVQRQHADLTLEEFARPRREAAPEPLLDWKDVGRSRERYSEFTADIESHRLRIFNDNGYPQRRGKLRIIFLVQQELQRQRIAERIGVDTPDSIVRDLMAWNARSESEGVRRGCRRLMGHIIDLFVE